MPHRYVRFQKMTIPYTPQFVNIDELAEFIAVDAPEPQKAEDLVDNDIFKVVRPGKERVCLILRAEGLEYAQIAWAMGITAQMAEKIILNIKDRLIKHRNSRLSTIQSI